MIISGQLLTKVGGPIQWATITFDPANGFAISFQTDFEGKYSQDIPVGSYRVTKKEKFSIEEELLGCNVVVDASGTITLEALIDRNTVPSYTAATLPDPDSLPVGQVISVDGHEFRPTGNGLESDYYAGSGVPFVLPSSGSVTSTSGDVSVATAFYSIIGPSFTWYQQGALFALSPAGWYFTVWTSTTVGKVYANTYLSGEPSIPVSPTPLTTVIGSYTQVINQYINGPAFPIPGSVMGKNGILEWHRHVSGFSSATQKTTASFFGLEVAHSGQFTANTYVALSGSLVNRGTPLRQTCVNSAYGDSGLGGSISKLVTDTLDVQYSITAVKLAAATDYVIIEATTAFAKRGI